MRIFRLLFFFLFVACSNGDKVDVELDYFEQVQDSVIFLVDSNLNAAEKLAEKSLLRARSHSLSAEAIVRVALGIIHKERGKYENALREYDTAQEIADQVGNNQILSNIFNNRGLVYKNLGEYEKAESQFRSSLKIRTKLHDEIGMSRCFNNISIVLKKQGNLDSSLHYALKSLKLKEESGNRNQLANSWISIGTSWQELGKSERALSAYRNAIRLISPQKERSINLGVANLNLGNYWINTQSLDYYLDSAVHYYLLAQEVFEHLGVDPYKLIALDALGVAYTKLKSYSDAFNCLSKSREMAIDFNDPEGRIIANIHLYEYYVATNKRDSALNVIHRAKKQSTESERVGYLSQTYLKLRDHFKAEGILDSTLFFFEKYWELTLNERNQQIQIRSKEIEERFNNEKHKSEKLQAQQAQKEEEAKNQRLMIAAVLLIVIIVLVIVMYQQRLKARNELAAKNEELHRQKLDDVVKEKELERVTALMEGQEKERTRIARELHDGLGSLLATVKHHYQNVEDKLDTGNDQFESANKLLDDACVEVRRISHDMASNVLSKFGLVAALQDYAETISASGAIKLNLKVSGVNDRLDNSTEIHLFRIVQELVNNVLKHAKASSANILLTAHKKSLNIIVEDDGIGFNKDDADQKNGMGLSNLRARVTHLKGQLDIDTHTGQGTTVVIDVPAA